MPDAPRQTRSYLMSLFEQRGIHPRHDLGQNFLIDLNLHDLILAEADLGRHEVALEVGSGTGALTAALADEAAGVVSVEYDRRMHEMAAELVGDRPHVRLLHGDVLKNKNRLSPAVLDALQELLADRAATSIKLVANLPYNVATPVISNLVATALPWSRMVVTIQFELAERMTAAPGSDSYGALSVWLQAQTNVTLIRKLSPAVFWPRPQVDSAIVRIDRDPLAGDRIVDREFFQAFVRDVFTQRRKQLRKVIIANQKGRAEQTAIDALFVQIGIPGDARAEQVSAAQFIQLANGLAPYRSPMNNHSNHNLENSGSDATVRSPTPPDEEP